MNINENKVCNATNVQQYATNQQYCNLKVYTRLDSIDSSNRKSEFRLVDTSSCDIQSSSTSSSYVQGISYSCTVYGRTTSVDCATSTGASCTAVAHAAAQRCQHRVRGSGPAPKPPEPDRCKSRTGPVPVVEFRYAVSLSRLNDRMVSPGCKYEDALGGAVHPTRLQAGLIVTWRMPSAS